MPEHANPSSAPVPRRPARTRAVGVAILVLCLAASACAQTPRHWDIEILEQTFGVSEPAQIAVPIDEVLQGCPMRDCIPSIDRPEFLAPGESGLTADEDLVLGVVHEGEARAYPIHILNFHEIVNDRIGDLAFAVTWCPLCGSGLVFDRRLDGEAVEFGVSGLLHNSDLILYDRASNSLWQQITGEAIAGPRRGQRLIALPSSLTRWDEWRAAHPQSRLLSARTGHERDYGQKQPYGDYDRSERLLFPARAAAGLRLHPKTVVFGAEFDGRSVAVSERALRAEPSVRIELDGVSVRFRRRADGGVEVVHGDGRPGPVAHRMFWFAWASFHPGTVLYDPEGRASEPAR